MDIFKYLRFRAEEEGEPFSLEVTFFVFWLEMGEREFFKCLVDEEGNVLVDSQNPNCLQRYWFEKFQQVHGQGYY